MKIIKTALPGCVVIEPAVHGDARGFFYESFNAARFAEAGLDLTFVQTNVSRSAHGVLRGLHYQWPNPQGKLVSVLEGEVYDVAVDIRVGSPTFGRWAAAILSADNKRHFWVPEGFAHGFAVLSENATFVYQCTALVRPRRRRGHPLERCRDRDRLADRGACVVGQGSERAVSRRCARDASARVSRMSRVTDLADSRSGIAVAHRVRSCDKPCAILPVGAHPVRDLRPPCAASSPATHA